MTRRLITGPTPAQQVTAAIDNLDPAAGKLLRTVRSAMQKRFPTANELAYDYGHSFVLSYSPTDRGVDAVLAISAKGPAVFLYFNQGPDLPDPTGILRGSGRQTRFIEIDSAKRLKDPAVDALINAAIKHATTPLARRGKGTVIYKATAASKRAAK